MSSLLKSAATAVETFSGAIPSEAELLSAAASLFINETTNEAHEWMVELIELRRRIFLRTVEPVVVLLLGPVVEDTTTSSSRPFLSSYPDGINDSYQHYNQSAYDTMDQERGMHRRLGFLPSYVSNVNAFRETSMSFATLIMLFVTLLCLFLIFLSCFYHNQKTSPLFISPRRHRLPKLVPPPLPVDGYFSWVKVCFFLSDEEIINRIGYDSLIFLRFHRLALRCIVKMSVFSFIVLLPLNFTGGGHANAQDLKEYVGSLFFTDFLRFTMANVVSGSPRLWVHCFAAYLLTGIVCRELLIEYETFNSIRHRYLLSREPHLRTVLVTNIPRHLRSARKITSYFKHVYPNAVDQVCICQNLIQLEALIQQRTKVLSLMEKELLILCRTEKQKLYEQSFWKKRLYYGCLQKSMEDCGIGINASQERLAAYYESLEQLNEEIENEQRRRRRVMKMLDKMEPSAEGGAADIDYVLASPIIDTHDPKQRRVLGLSSGIENQKKVHEGQDGPAIEAGAMSAGDYQPPLQPLSGSIPEGNEDEDNTSDLPPVDSNVDQGSQSKQQQLRSRSPAITKELSQQSDARVGASGDADGVFNDLEGDGNDAKKKRFLSFGKGNNQQRRVRPFAKAKRAIRQYGRNQDVSVLGKPILRSLVNPQSDGHMEDHINEVTDKAFVVMRTFTAATVAIQSMHSSKPGSMQVTTAPEPRDILWKNIYISKGAHRTRSYLGEVLVLLLITFYVVPVALVSLLVSESALISTSPRLAQLDQASAFFSAAIASVQPLCIVGLQQLLPPLFIAIGQAEGMLSFSEVQMRAFSRYFLFQVVNVFLVTTIAGSIFDTIAIIIANPESAFEMLGNSLPRMSSFFITFVTIKTFLALGVEMVRILALVQATTRYILFPNATLRTRRTIIAGMRSIDDPGWFPFHKILAQDMLVVLVSVVFAVVAPLVLFPCALFCLFSRILWTHHHLYVYESVFESGGQFWPKIFRRFVFGLIIAQMTITGQFILKDARHEAYATIALMFLTYFFLRATRARYDSASSTLPLEVATVMDISLQQEEQAEAVKQVPGPGETHHPPSLMPNSSLSPANNHGSMIGRFDPFRKAYLQPALRANPRARPEQPFPPAQLGRESEMTPLGDGIEGLGVERPDDSQDEDWQDSGATVRLKSLNQQDRRLINRWWKDQLQSAGKQDFFSVLIGQECGTLTISGASSVDVEMHDQASFPKHEVV